jgi:hypothetical protein
LDLGQDDETMTNRGQLTQISGTGLIVVVVVFRSAQEQQALHLLLFLIPTFLSLPLPLWFVRPMELLKINPDSEIVKKILLHVASSWLEAHDNAYFKVHQLADIMKTLDQLFSILLDVFEIHKFPRHMFVPAIMYCDRFVRKYGIRHNQLFNLLLTRYVLMCVVLISWSILI